MKFSNEIKAGIIAIVSIVCFVLLFQFMKGRSMFSSETSYFAKFENVEGMESSTPVVINGLKVGQVNKIIPVIGKKGEVSFIAEILVQNKYKFSKKSILELASSGLMDDKVLKINMSYGEPYAIEGDTLLTKHQLPLFQNLSSQVSPIKDEVQVVLKRIDSLADNANKVFDAQNRAELKALLTNLNRLSKSIESTSQQANNLVTISNAKLDKVLDNANLATISAKGAIDKFGNVADKLDVQKINLTIEKLSLTAEQLNNVISGIQKGNGSLGKFAKDEQLYNNLTETLENLNKLIKDLKENPKRYVHFSVFGRKDKSNIKE